MPIDWKLYERDVVRWYLDEDKTAHETIKLLKERHSLDVSLRQFKARFNGLKNLHANEWAAVIPELRKREVNGVKSEIYIHGRPLKLESMVRAIRRYSKNCRSDSTPAAAIDLGINTVGEHRIEIRTLQSSDGESSRTHNLIGPLLASERPEMEDAVIAVEAREAPEPRGHDFPIDLDPDLDIVDVDFSAQLEALGNQCFSPSLYLSLDPSVPSSPRRLLLQRPEQGGPVDRTDEATYSQWSLVSSSPRLVSLRPPLLFTHRQQPFQSFWDSPGISALIQNTNELEALVQSDRQLSFSRSLQSDAKGPLYSKLGCIEPKVGALQPIVELLDERYRNYAMTSRSVPDILETASDQSFYQFFSVVAYLVSNNLVESSWMIRILNWVMKSDSVPKFLTFLQSPPARDLGFGLALLGALCREGRFSIRSMRLAHRPIPEELLSLVELHCIDLGVRAFYLAIQWGSLELVNRLVSRGLAIDSEEPSDPIPSQSPFSYAIENGLEDVVRHFISMGVDVNQTFHVADHDEETNALSLAICKRHYEITKLLLECGAKIHVDDQLLIDGSPSHISLRRENQHIFFLLQDHSAISDELHVVPLIEAARKGNVSLSKVMLSYDIASKTVLERALCEAINMGDSAAVGTLLGRDIDPNIGLRLLAPVDSDHDSVYVGKYSFQRDALLHEILYLLVGAGANLDSGTVLKLYSQYSNRWDCNFGEKYGDGPACVLQIILQSGCKASWVYQELLTHYATNGRIFNCGCLLEEGVPINEYGLRGRNALQLAAGSGHLALVQLLLRRGADVNWPAHNSHPDGATALYAAIRAGHWETASSLIDSGANVAGAVASTNRDTLLEAFTNRFCDQRGMLFPSEENGGIPLEEGGLIFKSLVALGAPVNRADGSGGILLHNLVRANEIESLELALSAGARPNDTFHGITPLHMASLRKYSDAIELLINYGGDVNTSEMRDSDDNATLESIEASIFGRDIPFSFHFGFSWGRFGSTSGKFPFTVLQAAVSCEKPSLEIIKLLLRHGAEVNAPPARKGGMTALQGAATKGYIEVARLLIAHGAIVNAAAAPEDGRTAIEGAAEHGRRDMVRFLLSEGALPDPIDGFSRAIELAKKELHLGIVALLRKEEAKYSPQCATSSNLMLA